LVRLRFISLGVGKQYLHQVNRIWLNTLLLLAARVALVMLALLMAEVAGALVDLEIPAQFLQLPSPIL
jgi:hypothetical protein